VSKPPAKAAAASKTAVKTAKTTAPDPAPAKPAAKSAAKASTAPAAPAKTAAAAPKTAASKSSAAKASPQPETPAVSATPTSNRFTDRFAPARPATRPMTETADLPKTTHKADPKLANAWKTKAGRDLTEDELLAMPEDEYMNEKQLDFFRARLQKQKDDLLSNAGETTEHLREDTSIVPDPADRATIEEEHALELRTRDRERKLLKKIAQSLTRLESGDYGFCDETGEPIGLQRLMARPTATLSLEAQQRRELKQKMFGD
jgi:DnaK suppressor protein